jgi:hypothetical protein
VATERDHRGRSIVRGMLDIDDVSPDGYNVQGLRHAARSCASFYPKEPSPIIVEARFVESKRQLQTAVSPHQLKIGHMFI